MPWICEAIVFTECYAAWSIFFMASKFFALLFNSSSLFQKFKYKLGIVLTSMPLFSGWYWGDPCTEVSQTPVTVLTLPWGQAEQKLLIEAIRLDELPLPVPPSGIMPKSKPWEIRECSGIVNVAAIPKPAGLMQLIIQWTAWYENRTPIAIRVVWKAYVSSSWVRAVYTIVSRQFAK